MVRWTKKREKALLRSNWGEEYILNPEKENKIGRSNLGDIVLKEDLHVSRQNSVITYDEQNKTYHIEDVRSKHGTYVNGAEVIEKTELKSGDVIKIGKFTKLTFEIR
jgi:pSer/pThr/pTyr-binding forkhead associated (FHA) protein